MLFLLERNFKMLTEWTGPEEGLHRHTVVVPISAMGVVFLLSIVPYASVFNNNNNNSFRDKSFYHKNCMRVVCFKGIGDHPYIMSSLLGCHQTPTPLLSSTVIFGIFPPLLQSSYCHIITPWLDKTIVMSSSMYTNILV